MSVRTSFCTLVCVCSYVLLYACLCLFVCPSVRLSVSVRTFFCTPGCVCSHVLLYAWLCQEVRTSFCTSGCAMKSARPSVRLAVPGSPYVLLYAWLCHEVRTAFCTPGCAKKPPSQAEFRHTFILHYALDAFAIRSYVPTRVTSTHAPLLARLLARLLAHLLVRLLARLLARLPARHSARPPARPPARPTPARSPTRPAGHRPPAILQTNSLRPPADLL